jgi:hypothetical protein
MALRLAAVVALAALAAGCGGGKPHFQSAAGWQQLSRSGELAVANVPFRAADRSLDSPPSGTVATLPRSGIVIWLLVGRHHKSKAWDRKFPPVPLRVEETVATNPPEGFSCPPAARSDCFEEGGAIRRMQARASGWDVAATVFFGTDRPLPEDLAAADAELARLRLPGARARPPAKKAACPQPSGSSAYASTVRPSSGPPGSTATISGRFPGKVATEVAAYWNLDFDHWPSLTSSSPRAVVGGVPVKLLGTQYVAGRCSYRVRVVIPASPPGRYPLEVLYGDAQGGASFVPVYFRVTGG